MNVFLNRRLLKNVFWVASFLENQYKCKPLHILTFVTDLVASHTSEELIKKCFKCLNDGPCWSEAALSQLN